MNIKMIKTTGCDLLPYSETDHNKIQNIENATYNVSIDVEIKVKQNRSVKQNRYYWGVVLYLLTRAVDDSYTAEQFHEALKGA